MRDRDIVELFWARSEEAVGAAAEKYGGYCRAVAGRIVGEQEALEVVNDTWLAAWNSIPPHRPEDLRTYLGTVARRLALKRWRGLRAQKRGGGEPTLALEELEECVPGGASPQLALEAAELGRAIGAFLRGLPETERNVFVLRYWHVRSLGDICRRLGFSESKVKSMLARTRKKLKKYLVEEGYYEDK